MTLLTLPVLTLVLAGTLRAEPQEIALVRRLAGEEVARGRLVVADGTIRGEMTGSGVTVRGSVSRDVQGRVTAYACEVRGTEPDRLVERTRLEIVPGGYRFTETRVLGTRTRLLEIPPISVVIDPAWYEALIPQVGPDAADALRVLFARTGIDRTVVLLPRESGARYLDLPSGGLTWTPGVDGSFKTLVLPEGVRIERADGAPTAPPPSVWPLAVGAVSWPATLALPEALADAPEAALPGVVLLGDRGLRTPDGDPPGAGSGLLASLARDLSRSGWATLRVGKPDANLDLDMLQRAARVAAEGLAADPRVGSQAIVLIGHGEGGLIAALVAVQRPDLIGGVIGLGAPACPLPEALTDALRVRLSAAGALEAELQAAVQGLQADLEELRNLEPGVDPGPGRRLLRDLLAVDPATTWLGLDVPALLLYGDSDAEIGALQLSRLRSALGLGGGSHVRLQVLRDADHGFLRQGPHGALEGGPGIGSDVARPRHPALVPFVRAFLEGIPPGEPRDG